MEWIGKVLEWLKDFLLWLPLKLWQMLLEALSGLLAAIPVPSFFAQASAAFSSIDPGVLYFAQVMQLHLGIPMLLGAYSLRFLIRRLPVVG